MPYLVGGEVLGLVHDEELGHEVVVADPDFAPMDAQRVLFPLPWFRRS